MGCKDTDRKHTCGTKLNARCTYYDKVIPECSDLSASDCVTIEETTEDTYKMVCELKDGDDLTALGDACIDYEEAIVGEIKVKEALEKHEELICALQAVNDAGDCPIDISCMNLDTSCLEDSCGTGFSTLEALLQNMINTICNP